MLNHQHMDFLEHVLVGAEVGIPVVDAGVDARVGLHISRLCCWQLYDVVDPKFSCSIFEDIEDFLGVCHGEG